MRSLFLEILASFAVLGVFALTLTSEGMFRAKTPRTAKLAKRQFVVTLDEPRP